MSKTVKLTNYTDFDRLLIGKNFIITLIGTLGAFSLSYFQIYIEIPFPPYGLSLALGVMIITAIYCKNIASSIIVALGGSIGLVSVTTDGLAEFFQGYLLINLVVLIIIGYLADRLRLILSWTKFYILFGIFFSIASIVLSIMFNPNAGQYWANGYAMGNGGNFGTDYPVIDLAWLVGLILLSLLFIFITKGEMSLADSSLPKYKILGTLFVLAGAAVTFVPLYLYGLKFTREELSGIALIDRHLLMIDDLFSHQADGAYASYGDPVSVFFIIATTTVLTMIGISLLMIGKNGGNLKGMKGGSEVVFLTPPLAILAYFVYGSYYVQDFIYSGSFFISSELFPIFATMIWITFYINSWVARLVLFVLDRL